MKCYSIIAAAPPQKQGETPQNPMGSMWVMLLLMFVIMYFIIIRPQSKQRKEQAARVASLSKGDKIISIGGLHGTVHHISKTTVTVKLSEGVFVPFEKEAVRSVTNLGKGKKKDQEQTDDHEKDASADSEE